MTEPHMHPVQMAFGYAQQNPLDPKTGFAVFEVREGPRVTRFEIDPSTARVLLAQLTQAVQQFQGTAQALQIVGNGRQR
jgi:hypothetical protein